MRTDDEIIARIGDVGSRDWMRVEVTDLYCRLSFDKARPFLQKPVKTTAWRVSPRDRISILSEMFYYLPFAWSKVNGGKILSAALSMSHYSSWIWLAGDDLGNLLNYDGCGKEKLILICKYYNWDYKSWEKGL